MLGCKSIPAWGFSCERDSAIPRSQPESLSLLRLSSNDSRFTVERSYGLVLRTSLVYKAPVLRQVHAVIGFRLEEWAHRTMVNAGTVSIVRSGLTPPYPVYGKVIPPCGG